MTKEQDHRFSHPVLTRRGMLQAGAIGLTGNSKTAFKSFTFHR